MFKFLLPKQFFIKEKKIHKNLYEKAKPYYDFGRFDNGNIIINFYDDETVIFDKNYVILYKENIGNIDFITIINNDQFIGIKNKELCLFSFIYSNYTNSDSPSEPLNQKKIIKINSQHFFKLRENYIVKFFYDKNNNKIYLPQCNDLNLDYEIFNYYILIFDVFKNKIALKAKLKFVDNDLCSLKCIIFNNKYLIVSKINSLRVFNANNMKEIIPGINNLELDNKNYIKDLMNLDNEFLLILTQQSLIQYDLHKREILYSCRLSFELSLISVERLTTTKNYLFIYEKSSGVIIFDKKTIRPIQSKHIPNIFFIDEVSDENIKFTTACYNIFCDKSQKNKIYLFFCIRVFSIFLLLFLFIREKRNISSKKYKLLREDVINDLLKFKNIKNINNISLEDITMYIIKYIKSISFSFDNLRLIVLKFVFEILMALGKVILSPFIIIFMFFKILFFSNYLIIIIARCMIFIYCIFALSFGYHELSPQVIFISDYY